MEGSLKAISEHSWYPVNHKLDNYLTIIDNETPESAKPGQDSTESGAALTAAALNTGGHGMIATVLGHILSERTLMSFFLCGPRST